MINKRKISFFLALLIFCSSFSYVLHAEEVPTLTIDAKSAILIEPTTGKIILEQNAQEQLAPASVTKVMTILLIYESIEKGKINWDDIVTVSSHAASMGGSQIFLEPMEQQPVKELTKSIVIASANDSAVAMGEFIAGSEEAFVGLMNKKAKSLGMDNTNFQNSCGLDEENHYSSAYDISIMTKELTTKYPEVFEYTTKWQDTIIHKTARGQQEFGLTNTNRLIKNYTGATGLKTGSTSKALYCLSATAERDGLSLVAVVLGAPDPKIRFQEAMKILDYGFATYAIGQGNDVGTIVGSIDISKGEFDKVDVEIKNKVTTLISKGKNTTLESEIKLLPSLNAPIEKGTKAGEIIYYFEEQEVGRSDLVTSSDVKIASISRIMEKLSKKWFDF